MDKNQERFLKREIFNATLMATLQRANVYRRDASEKDRILFRGTLRARLEQIEPAYYVPLGEEDHIRNIIDLSNGIAKDHENCLADGCFRIGLAQKAINLYLKYLWCLGKIPTPPHCPFDSYVIAQLPGCRAIRWTEANEDQYRQLVKAARVQAQGVPLAVWELLLYNNNDPFKS